MKNLGMKQWTQLYHELSPQEFLDQSAFTTQKGVLQLRARAQKQLEKNAFLQEQWNQRNQPKRKLQAQGHFLIGGMDEAGRGPLAGPVVAAVVVLSKPILGLRDSKKLSERRREELFHCIKEDALAYGIGWASHQEIDELNVLEATKLAMKRALNKMDIQLDALLLDGNPLHLHSHEVALVGGDDLSNEIAAASILAKVTRDHWMMEMDSFYPAYGFSKHKGYGTREHMDALLTYGPCELHRKSFLSFLNEKGK